MARFLYAFVAWLVFSASGVLALLAHIVIPALGLPTTTIVLFWLLPLIALWLLLNA